MRNRDTTAATAANRKRKHDRWARELWETCRAIVFPTNVRLPESERGGLQAYATNGLRETYRVTGWTGAGEPILAGREGDFVGLHDYVFTYGPR
jgi:hypothetical protein